MARYEFVTSDFDDPRIEEVKARVRRMNEDQAKIEKDFPDYREGWYHGWTGEYKRGLVQTHRRYYVWLRGRGSRSSPEKIKAWKDVWQQKYGKPYRWSDESVKNHLKQDLPLWMAERAAVYIMERRYTSPSPWTQKRDREELSVR